MKTAGKLTLLITAATFAALPLLSQTPPPKRRRGVPRAEPRGIRTELRRDEIERAARPRKRAGRLAAIPARKLSYLDQPKTRIFVSNVACGWRI
jgi:hypothetical protein